MNSEICFAICLKAWKGGLRCSEIGSIKLYLPKNEFIVMRKFRSFVGVVHMACDGLEGVVLRRKEKKLKKN